MSKKVLYRPTVGQLVTLRSVYGRVSLYASRYLQYHQGCIITANGNVGIGGGAARAIGMMSSGEIGCILQAECRDGRYTSIRILVNGIDAWVSTSYVVVINTDERHHAGM